MKEKYIFFTLLIIGLLMLIGARVSEKKAGEISAEEQALEKKLKQAAQKQFPLPEKINIDKLQNLVSFSHYAGLLRRSLFFKVQPRPAEVSKTGIPVIPVEEKTPRFIYKGKIASANREVVIIEQTRSGEVFMVAKGENIDGYKVLDITDTEVILSKKGKENIVLKTIERP